MEDKLNRDERIRLEALAQANASFGMGMMSAIVIIDKAKEFEKYIRNGEVDNNGS